MSKVRRRQVIFVGSKIRALRKDRSLTQSSLAQRIGVQQSDLCRMENGEYKVSLETLFKILTVFGMDIGEFFYDQFPPSTPQERDQEILVLLDRLDDDSRTEVIEFIRYKLVPRNDEQRSS